MKITYDDAIRILEKMKSGDDIVFDAAISLAVNSMNRCKDIDEKNKRAREIEHGKHNNPYIRKVIPGSWLGIKG